MAEEIVNNKTNEEENINTTEEVNSSDGTQNTDEPVVEQRIPYDRFKQKVDEANALKEKLAKIERQQQAEETRQLEEQNEYKTLYNQALDTIKQAEADALTQKKESLLTKAGYNEAQIDKLSKLVDGDDEETIKASIESLKETFPVAAKKYADPSVGNDKGTTPEQVEGEDIGRKLFDRLLANGKIKGFKK